MPANVQVGHGVTGGQQPVGRRIPVFFAPIGGVTHPQQLRRDAEGIQVTQCGSQLVFVLRHKGHIPVDAIALIDAPVDPAATGPQVTRPGPVDAELVAAQYVQPGLPLLARVAFAFWADQQCAGYGIHIGGRQVDDQVADAAVVHVGLHIGIARQPPIPGGAEGFGCFRRQVEVGHPEPCAPIQPGRRFAAVERTKRTQAFFGRRCTEGRCVRGLQQMVGMGTPHHAHARVGRTAIGRVFVQPQACRGGPLVIPRGLQLCVA